MNPEKLIGRKVRGFKFESFENMMYNSFMDKKIGKVGIIEHYDTESRCFSVKIEESKYFYPADQIEAHLVEDEIPTLSDGVMMLVSDDGKNYHERNVLGTKNGLCYVWNESQLETFIYYKPLKKEPTKEEQLTAILGSDEKVKEIMELFNCKE